MSLDEYDMRGEDQRSKKRSGERKIEEKREEYSMETPPL